MNITEARLATLLIYEELGTVAEHLRGAEDESEHRRMLTLEEACDILSSVERRAADLAASLAKSIQEPSKGFPFEEINRYDTLSEAIMAGAKEDHLWSVVEGDTGDTYHYGPPRHYINLLYIVETKEKHDGDTYYDED